MSGPRLKPSIRKPAHAPMADARRSGALAALIAASVAGTASAAAKPCMARPASSTAGTCAVAITTDATANNARPKIETNLAPARSHSLPPGMMQAAETMR